MFSEIMVFGVYVNSWQVVEDICTEMAGLEGHGIF